MNLERIPQSGREMFAMFVIRGRLSRSVPVFTIGSSIELLPITEERCGFSGSASCHNRELPFGIRS